MACTGLYCIWNSHYNEQRRKQHIILKLRISLPRYDGYCCLTLVTWKKAVDCKFETLEITTSGSASSSFNILMSFNLIHAAYGAHWRLVLLFSSIEGLALDESSFPHFPPKKRERPQSTCEISVGSSLHLGRMSFQPGFCSVSSWLDAWV